jgi:hypothetical protein
VLPDAGEPDVPLAWWIQRARAAITAWRHYPRAPALPSTQLQWLGYDTIELRRLLDSTPSFVAPLADFTDVDRHAKHLVVADLTWRIWHLAMGIHLLLEHEIPSPAVVLTRALWEALATVAYLVQHPKFQDEAIILLAFSFLEQAKQFAHQPELVKERTEILDRMPATLVAEARRRAARKPFTWSGLNMRQLSAAGRMKGYAEAYAYFSTETHGTLMGEHVKVVRGDDGKAHITTGRTLDPKTIESLANFARRSLHAAFKTMWGVLDAPPVVFHGDNPETWQKAQPPS